MKHNKKHSFSKCHQCNFNSYDKREIQSHISKEHNKITRKRLEKRLKLSISLTEQERKSQAARFDCIDVKCKREGDHYLGLTPGDRKIHSQEVAKEMLRVVLEVVAVLVKRR